MIRSILAIAAVALGITAVAAQSDPIAARKALMKKNGDLTKIGAAMDKGEAPIRSCPSPGNVCAYIEAAGKLPELYPENSKTGGDTSAAPKIWEDMAGFKERFAKFGSDAKAAQAASKDLASFKAQFGAITKSCGGCHEVYRSRRPDRRQVVRAASAKKGLAVQPTGRPFFQFRGTSGEADAAEACYRPPRRRHSRLRRILDADPPVGGCGRCARTSCGRLSQRQDDVLRRSGCRFLPRDARSGG